MGLHLCPRCVGDFVQHIPHPVHPAAEPQALGPGFLEGGIDLRDRRECAGGAALDRAGDEREDRVARVLGGEHEDHGAALGRVDAVD